MDVSPKIVLTTDFPGKMKNHDVRDADAGPRRGHRRRRTLVENTLKLTAHPRLRRNSECESLQWCILVKLNRSYLKNNRVLETECKMKPGIS